MKTASWQFDHGWLLRALAFILLVIGSGATAFSLYQQPYDDLPSFYWATRLVFDNAVSPYQPEYFQMLGKELDRKIYPFLYPPPALIIFSPFLLVEYPQAKTVFSLLNLFLWWCMAWMAYRLYCALKSVEHDTKAAIIIFLALLVFAPVIDTIRTGQVNLVVIACLVPLMCNSRKSSVQLLAGALLAVAIALKVYLLLLLPLALIFRVWKTLLSTLVTMALLCIVAFVSMPTDVWGDWLTLSQQGGGYGKLMPHVMTLPWNQSLNGFLLRLASGHEAAGWYAYWPMLLYVVAVVLVASVFLFTARYTVKAPGGMAWAVAMVLATVNVIAPLTWLHHFVFIIPAIVIGVVLSGSEDWSKGVLLLAAAVMGIPAMTNWLFGLPVPWPASGQIGFSDNLAMSIPLIAGTCLWLSLFRHVRRAHPN